MATRTRATGDTATPQKRRVRVSTEPLTPDEHTKAQETFLAEYATHGNVTAACKKAGIHRATFYRWQEHDETFSMRHQQAKDVYCDKLRQEIDRRATQGWLEPVVSAGKLVTRVRKYSDTLLIFQAKAHMPEYRDKVDVKATIQGNVTHDINLAEDAEASSAANAFLRRLTALRTGDASGSSVSGE